MQSLISPLQIAFLIPNEVDQEIPTLIQPTNGTQVTEWTLAHTPIGIPHIYVNGIRQFMGADFTINDNILTSNYWGLLNIPVILVDYKY